MFLFSLRVNCGAMSAEILSVTELNRRARQALERALPLLWVTGEISNFVRAASGHLYFTLKDEAAQVRCAMFRSRANLVPWQIVNGQQVEVQALVSVYEARGDFQLNVEAMRRGGLGRLYEVFAKLRAKLEGEGLFAAERKRALPVFPRALGIVTSLQAAALRDIVAACRRRAPHLPLIIFPTPVQGDGAAEQIAQAINAASTTGCCDVLLVARGGGSIEDLWPFNEEVVTRAIAACAIPVISGVGHETDTTIADFVADHRAATPTAAAELATTGWFAAMSELDQLRNELQRHLRRQIEARMQRVDTLSRRLLHPRQRLERIAMANAYLRMRLDAAMRGKLTHHAGNLATMQLRLQRQRPNVALAHSTLAASAQRFVQALHASLGQPRHRLDNAADALKLLDPNATLARGYCIVRDTEGKLVIDSGKLRPGDEVALQFASGDADAQIIRTR
ncbi:Exodeoxyribonuclease 7 large subunit [Georgfuchsia toluolica]|uniref:Exodeoxyribonuclease 7 large subunit n=2 Tax=Georgfuchsia toluolica TaxID=424218 RepID=A0A916J7J8_9PROT|nr:Exodeoxyribonuclease 7 large subunit [Georgfuchsia toluolica]